MALSLGGIATATKAKKGGKEKPILPDPTGKLVPLVAQGIENAKHIAAHEGALKSVKEALTAAAFAHACTLYQGRAGEIEDSFQIGTASGKAIVSLQNRYKVPEDVDSVRAIMGDAAGELLREKAVIEIDCDAMPAFMVDSFADELVKLARASDAILGTPEGENGPMFSALSVRKATGLAKSFHESRYSLLSPEANARLDAVMPCTKAVKFDY